MTLPIFVLIKIFSYLSKEDCLRLRFLNKRIAAAFRPKIIVLDEKTANMNLDHIKKVICHDLYKFLPVLEKNLHIKKLVTKNELSSDSKLSLVNYFKNLTHLECKINNLGYYNSISFENLVYYKGPSHYTMRELPNLKIVYLSLARGIMSCFSPGLEKIVICKNSGTLICELDLSSLKHLKYFALRSGADITEFRLPENIEVLKIPYHNIFCNISPGILFKLKKLSTYDFIFGAPNLKKLITRNKSIIINYKNNLEILHYIGTENLNLSGLPLLRKFKLIH